jgi:hypothetical protein
VAKGCVLFVMFCTVLDLLVSCSLDFLRFVESMFLEKFWLEQLE